MSFGPILTLFLLAAVMIVLIARRIQARRGRLRRRGPGAGAAGAVYELLNEERRRALEIIVDERAEATDPEHKDGNLPDLEDPARRPR